MKKIYTKNTSVKYISKRAVCFAGYNKDCLIEENVILYLKELKKYSDYIVFVMDNEIILSELEKIKDIVDAVICNRHCEYDFGSYKQGYILLKEENILYNIDNLLFVNDSVIYKGADLENVFKLSTEHAFYGLTIHAYGYIKSQIGEYAWGKAPHVQSFFFQISKDIANSEWFDDFIKSVQQEKCKEDIIFNYEIGLSKLVNEHGYSLNSYYKYIDDNIEPCKIYCNPVKINKNTVLLKKSLYKNKLKFLQNFFRKMLYIFWE